MIASLVLRKVSLSFLVTFYGKLAICVLVIGANYVCNALI